MNPHPFAFLDGPQVRRHGPAGWKDYARYRQWLRDEFCFRCVYCLNREKWMDLRRGYQIDHFVPQKLRPDLKNEYSNLLFLCAACNNMKGAELLPDPCEIPLNQCIKFFDDGEVEAIKPYEAEGVRLIEVLELDDPRLIQYRKLQIGTIKTHAQYHQELYMQMMEFPTDLPDLELDRPPKNTRPEGVQESWFFRRREGSLPQVY